MSTDRSIEWIGGYDEAAIYMHSTPRQVRRWRSEGKISCVRMGGRVQFTKQQLDEFIERSTITAVNLKDVPQSRRVTSQESRRQNGGGATGVPLRAGPARIRAKGSGGRARDS
jgi:excisionase family DNA binding protein